MKTVSKKARGPKQVKYVVPNVEEDCILVVKVGSDERPAGVGDIADMAAKLSQVINDPRSVFVTHHAVDFVVIPRKLFGSAVVKPSN